MQINVKFGSEQYTRSYEDGTTVGEVLADHDLKMVVGWGDNVRALVAGVEQPSHAVVGDGATLVVETRANAKASRHFRIGFFVEFGK